MEVVIAVALVGLLAFSVFSARPEIGGEEARKLVAEGATLVDVRSPGEFRAGHVEGARNIPVDVIDGRRSEIPTDAAVLVYCQSGIRSGRAARLLRKHGYDARNLGGIARAMGLRQQRK